MPTGSTRQTEVGLRFGKPALIVSATVVLAAAVVAGSSMQQAVSAHSSALADAEAAVFVVDDALSTIAAQQEIAARTVECIEESSQVLDALLPVAAARPPR